MAVDSKKIAEQISGALKSSPAYTQRPEVKKIVDAVKKDPNDGAMINALKNTTVPQEEVGAMTEALRRGENVETTPEAPLIDLAGLYGASSNIKQAAKIAKLSEPIDKSKGINFDEDGVATQNIATDRVLGTEGAGEYSQHVYDLGDKNGAPSSGVYDDSLFVRNLRAGNAGLNITTSSMLNPMDGSEGNPAMFSRRYPKLNTTVEPFKVKIPNYNLEVVSETLDPEKLAYQIATSVAGKPVSTYVGYTNVGFDITEPWYSTLAKGLGRAPIAVADMVGDALLLGPTLAAAGLPLADALAAYIGGADNKEVKAILNRELGAIAETYDDIAGGWNEAIDSFEGYLGLKNTSKAGGVATVVGEIPTIAGQIGLLWGIGALAAGSGLSLESSTALAQIVGGATFGLAQGSEEFEELGRKGVSPMVRFRNTAMGTAGSIALESLGLFATFSSKMAAARQFMKNYSRRQMLAAGEGALFGMAGEGLTEWGDQILQDYVTYNMGDDEAMNRLTNRNMAFVLGAVGGLAGLPAHVFNERVQIAREEIKKAKIAADSPQWLKELDTAVRQVANQGVYTKEQVLDMIIGMATPEGQKYLNQKQSDTLMGLLDRLSPEAVQYVKDIGARESEKVIETLNAIDQQTFNAIPETVDIQTRTMVARAMKAIAPLIEFRGGKFRMPTFVVRPNEAMEYDPKTNTLYINPNSVGEAIDFKYVQDKSLPLLDPVQRGILHELGHMLDSQLGRGTNYKEFFPAYFEAIAKVFGKEKAATVKSAMQDEANRLAYATSDKKKDVSEKLLAELTGDISDKNTSEYFAYALGRLGRRIGKAFGFTGSEVAEYIDAANIMAMTLQIPQITKQLTAYQNAMNTMIKKNDETLAAIAKAAGEEGLSRKIQDYAAGKIDALSKEDVVALYNILKSYVGIDGMKILDEAFAGLAPETFMQRAEREFKESIRQTGHTVGDIQAGVKKKLESEFGKNNSGTSVNEQTIGLDYDEDSQYTKVNEGVFDVTDILKDKKERVSALEKRTSEKPTGNDYETDVKNVTSMIQETKRVPKWFVRMFGGGDMNTALWSIGGKKLVEYFDLIPKMNRASDYATAKMEEFDNLVKKELGFKNNIERDTFMNNASIDSINVDYMVDPLTGDVISGKISPLVAMNVYLHSLNPKTRANMLNAFGGNSEQMQKVIDALTPEQKKYADLMQKFVADNWKLYRKSYQQEGEDIDEESYWPVVEAVHAAMGERKTNSNISRKGDASYAISLDVDAREIFNTYVQRVAGVENNVYSTIRRLKDLFGYDASEQTDDYPTTERNALSAKMLNNTRKLRGMAIRNMGDERRFNQFLELQNDFLAKREAMQVGSESLNIAARNLTAGLLQWKPIQFIKNLSNASGYWGAADNQAQYWKDTAWAATHPIEAAKYMFEKVPFLRNRFKGQNIDEALTQQTAGTDSLLMNWAKKTEQMGDEGKAIVSNIVALTQAARRLGYTPMLSGDMAANIVGGYGLLKQFETKYGDRAADKFAEFVVNHQTSSNQATRSLLQRRWSRDIRGELTRFATEQVQKVKSIGTAIAQVQQGERTAGNAAKEIASTLSSILIFSLISAGIIDLFDGNEENDKDVYEALEREGISAIVGGSVIGNSIIAPIIDSLFFGTSGGMGTPASKIIMSDLRKLSKGELEDAILDSIGSTIPLVGAKSFANSAKGIYRGIAAEDSKELKAGIYQALGRSENYAEERAGIKKKSTKK